MFMKRYIRSAEELSPEQKAKNSKDPKELAQLSNNPYWYVRAKVAENSNTPVEILKMLSKDSEDIVRANVALNPNTPVETLRSLAEDSDFLVRKYVTENSSTTFDILKLLYNDPDEYVRRSVASNSNIPVKILKVWAKDSDEDVRRGVAGNLSTPPEILKLLAKDSDEDVRRGVAGNLSTPPEILKLLAKDSYPLVRQNVAKNPNTPPESLRILIDDVDYVREYAYKNPNRPSDLRPKSKKNSWKSFQNSLEADLDDGVDPLYEQTDAGDELQSICTDVEDKLGIWLEPSIQAGMGGIWFYSKDDDEVLAKNYDYQTYNETVIDMALNSKNQTEFKTKYKNFLQDILNDPQYAPEEE